MELQSQAFNDHPVTSTPLVPIRVLPSLQAQAAQHYIFQVKFSSLSPHTHAQKQDLRATSGYSYLSQIYLSAI